MTPATTGSTVAVTGATGTVGAGFVPLLQGCDRVARIIGVARGPFDPADRGWTKMTYRRADVRDQLALLAAFDGADVVVHLAFDIVTTNGRQTARTTNVSGTLNAFRAAALAGARRFVYTSSVAAYGFHRDNPVGMTEDWPVRPAARMGYARDKAELERLLAEESAGHPDVELYLLRPCAVLGRHTTGGKQLVPGPLAPLVGLATARAGRRPLPVPLPLPAMPMQFVHEDDLGQALLLCVLGAGPPGTYNIAGDGVVTALDAAHELGYAPLPMPPGPVQAVAGALTRMPFLPGRAGWVEAASHPAIMDTTRAKEVLGWRPRHTGLEAFRAAVGGGRDRAPAAPRKPW